MMEGKITSKQFCDWEMEHQKEGLDKYKQLWMKYRNIDLDMV